MCGVKDPKNFVICDKEFHVYKVVSRPGKRNPPPGVFYSQYIPPERSSVGGPDAERGTFYTYLLGTESRSYFPGMFFYRHRETALEMANLSWEEYVLECVVPVGAKLWLSVKTGEILSSSKLLPVRLVEKGQQTCST